MTQWKLSSGRYATIAVVTILCALGAEWLLRRTPAYPRPIRVGINDSPPYAFIGPDNAITGPSKEVIAEAARRRGIPIEWVVSPEGPDAALASGKVEVWPLITILPRRMGKIFFTDPWLRAHFCLLVLRAPTLQKESDFANKTIAYRPKGPDLQELRKFFPQARVVPLGPVREIQAVCSGEVQAAFVESKNILVELLNRSPGCEGANLNILPLDKANYFLAVGANPKFASVAKELRSEMNGMDRDGSLSRIYKQWLFATSEETEIVSELTDTRQRALFLLCGVGVLTLVTGILILVVKRVRRAHKIARSAHDFVSAVLDVAGGLVVISDRSGRIVRMNRLCEHLTGYALSKVKGKAAWEAFVPPRERAQVEKTFASLAGGSPQTAQEYHWRAFNGEERLISWSNTVLLNSSQQIDYIISIGVDITDQKAAEVQLSYEAMHDQLTELPNRRHFQRVIASAAAEAASAGAILNLCLCDIDHFKRINDTFGHTAGDEVLSTFSRILREAARERNIAARLGGDEFALILRDMSTAQVQQTVERVRARLANCGFQSAEGETFRVTATFGVAELDGPYRTVSDLFKQADDALYRAKSLGRNRIATASRGLRTPELVEP